MSCGGNSAPKTGEKADTAVYEEVDVDTAEVEIVEVEEVEIQEVAVKEQPTAASNTTSAPKAKEEKPTATPTPKASSATTNATTERLRTIVSSMNASCPISLGAMGEMTSVVLQGTNNIVITCSVDESLVDISVLSQNTEVMKQSIVMTMANPTDPNMKMLVDIIKNNGAKMTYKYKGKTTGKTMSVTIDHRDIANHENSGGATASANPVAFLEQQIEITTLQCPMDLGGGLVMTKMVLEGDYATYYYDVDESLISIDLLQENKEASKAAIMSSINTDDVAMKAFVTACKKAGKGIAYKYVGATSKKVCLITIPVSEL